VPDPTEQLLAMIPYAATLGIEIDSGTPAEVSGRMPWREELTTGGGIIHGGALMGFADTLGAVCAFVNLPPGTGTTTISSSTNFMRAVRGGVVHGTARPLRAGKSVVVVQTELRDDAGELVAQITQAQAVLGART
jgi:uncharacterized protein (TIGR00369 family)